MTSLNEDARALDIHKITYGNGSGALFQSGKSYPYMILTRDDAPISSSSKIMLIKFSTRKISALYQEISTITYGYPAREGNPFKGMPMDEALKIYNDYLRVVKYPIYIKDLSVINKMVGMRDQYPVLKDTIEIINFDSPGKLANYLMTKVKVLSPERVYTLTGVHSLSDAYENTLKVGNSVLVFPENFRKSRTEQLAKLVTIADEVLAKRGYAFLTDVRMFVKPLPAKVVGYYFLNSRSIALDPTAKATDTALGTLIHELGHKYWYEFMPADKRQAVVDKYKELIKAEEHKDVAGKARQSDEEAYKQIDNGDTLAYVGPAKKKIEKQIKSFSPFTVVSVTPSKITIVSNETHYAKFSGSPAYMASNFSVNGVMIGDTTETGNRPAEASLKDIHDGWFPTAYSASKPEEWFAECFMFWIAGKIKYEPLKEFYDSILKI